MSLHCQSCPDTVQALNLMSVLNPRIRHVAIDGALFQAEVEARQILSVPTVYMNGAEFDAGRMSIEQILAKLDTGAAARAARALQAERALRPAGGRRRPGRRGGGDLCRAQGHPHRHRGRTLRRPGAGHDGDRELPSVEYTEGPKLAAALEAHVRSYGVDVMNSQRARAAAGRRDGSCIDRRSWKAARPEIEVGGPGAGARWRQTGVPGEADYRNKGVAYCPHCDGPLFKGKRVAVIGGGNSGVEAAIDLAGIVEHVTLLEFDGKLRADEVLQRKLRSLPNVTACT
jgi:alkyl hydroperoxide reductase subunit F